MDDSYWETDPEILSAMLADYKAQILSLIHICSAASGEGLVNVYRGTGKVMMAPVRNGPI